jgi:hypothetical protein
MEVSTIELQYKSRKEQLLVSLDTEYCYQLIQLLNETTIDKTMRVLEYEYVHNDEIKFVVLKKDDEDSIYLHGNSQSIIYITEPKAYEQSFEYFKKVRDNLKMSENTPYSTMLIIFYESGEMKSNALMMKPKEFKASITEYINKEKPKLSEEFILFFEKTTCSIQISKSVSVTSSIRLDEIRKPTIKEIFKYVKLSGSIDEGELLKIIEVMVMKKKVGVDSINGPIKKFALCCFCMLSYRIKEAAIIAKTGLDHNLANHNINVGIKLCQLYYYNEYEKIISEFNTIQDSLICQLYYVFIFYALACYKLGRYKDILAKKIEKFEYESEMEYKCVLLIGKAYLKCQLIYDGCDFLRPQVDVAEIKGIDPNRIKYLICKFNLQKCSMIKDPTSIIDIIHKNAFRCNKIYALMAKHYMKKKEYAKAKQEFQQLWEVPEKYYTLYAQCFFHSNDIETYIKYLFKCLACKNCPEKECRGQLCRIYLSQYKIPECIRCLELYNKKDSLSMLKLLLKNEICTKMIVEELHTIPLLPTQFVIAQCIIEAKTNGSQLSERFQAINCILAGLPKQSRAYKLFTFLNIMKNGGEYNKESNIFNKQKQRLDYKFTKALLLQMCPKKDCAMKIYKGANEKPDKTLGAYKRSWRIHKKIIQTLVEEKNSKKYIMTINLLNHLTVLQHSYVKHFDEGKPYDEQKFKSLTQKLYPCEGLQSN